MRLSALLLIVFCIGAIGGSVNALITDNGFIAPKTDQSTGIWRPGILGNMFLGGVAAALSWGLYGPHAPAPFIGGRTADTYILTLGQFAGVFLAGVGASRVITTEIDKRALAITSQRQIATTRTAQQNAEALATQAQREAQTAKAEAATARAAQHQAEVLATQAQQEAQTAKAEAATARAAQHQAEALLTQAQQQTRTARANAEYAQDAGQTLYRKLVVGLRPELRPGAASEEACGKLAVWTILKTPSCLSRAGGGM